MSRTHKQIGIGSGVVFLLRLLKGWHMVGSVCPHIILNRYENKEKQNNKEANTHKTILF